ncbi:MAG TPA: hypothetical protein VKE51_16580 [Vicinamibacterales bacterium]|nr:hypothetical protein [Vicinamibacterales bacterium]
MELDMYNPDDDGIVVDPLSNRRHEMRTRTPIGAAASIAWRRATGYIPRMRFERGWVEQNRATKVIKRRFGARSALDYLVGEKLISFADAARDDAGFARELPRFLAAIWQTFNGDEIAGYVASRKPKPQSAYN